MDFQKASNSSICTLAKFKQATLFFVGSRDSLLKSPQLMLCQFNIRLIIYTCKFSPDRARDLCNSLKVMCGLAFTSFIIFLVYLGDSIDGRPILGRIAVVLNAIHLEIICHRFEV